jgi:hypothetical protein
MRLRLALCLAFSLLACTEAQAQPTYDKSSSFTPHDLAYVDDVMSSYAIGSGHLRVMTFVFDHENVIIRHDRKPIIIFDFLIGDTDTGIPGGSFWGKISCEYKISWRKRSSGMELAITPVRNDECNDTPNAIVFNKGTISIGSRVIGSYY